MKLALLRLCKVTCWQRWSFLMCEIRPCCGEKERDMTMVSVMISESGKRDLLASGIFRCQNITGVALYVKDGVFDTLLNWNCLI